MFPVKRTNPPEGLESAKGYQAKDVVQELQKIFYDKCYLCESTRLEAPEVEHYAPKSLNGSLTNDWNNLFYSCRRCNSIKSANEAIPIDCTKVDAYKAIIIELPNLQSKPISIESTNETGATVVELNNTVELLNKCYNESGTPYRGITQAELRRKMYEHLELYYKYVAKIKKNESTYDVFIAKSRLHTLLQPSYPYHAIWRRMFSSDPELLKNHSEILDAPPKIPPELLGDY